MSRSSEVQSVVTGGSSGIGLAVAQRLAKRGKVLIIGRDESKCQAAVESIGSFASYAAGDVGQREQVTRLAEVAAQRLGKVDILVHCAGFLRPVAADDQLEKAADAWDDVISANLTGSFLMTQALLPIVPRPGGRVVFVSSIAAYTGGSGGSAIAYAAAKAGIIGLTHGYARSLGSSGVTVNAIVPGFIAETGFTGGWSADRVNSIVAQTPAGRPGTSDDVAGAVEFLATPDASFITGEVIHVNGGWIFGS